MTALIVDLAEFRAKRDEGRQIEELMIKTHEMRLQVDPKYAERVITARMWELLQVHDAILEALAPVMSELVLLRTAFQLTDRAFPTIAETTDAMAIAAASLARTVDLARTMPERIAELRARMPEDARRFEKAHGVDLFKMGEP